MDPIGIPEHGAITLDHSAQKKKGLTLHAFKFIKDSCRNLDSNIHACNAILRNNNNSTDYYDYFVPTCITRLG